MNQGSGGERNFLDNRKEKEIEKKIEKQRKETEREPCCDSKEKRDREKRQYGNETEKRR